MRTAITLSKSHKGEWSLVSSPSVPLPEQAAKFRRQLGIKVHAEIAEIHYQENDGHLRVLRFLSPDEFKKREDRVQKDLQAAKKDGEARKKLGTKEAQKKTESVIKKENENIAAEVKRLNDAGKKTEASALEKTLHKAESQPALNVADTKNK